ncbi:MAG: hypothetical protein R3300_17785 [Candidatus Promineifilaceae bacterium]|nr:hypothetical protein [Candidatus Promineifilaceae bacterium]
MGFLKKLFSGGQERRSGGDSDDGFFVYVQCDNCDQVVRLRIHKQHDLQVGSDGYTWHKTIVDSRCFKPIRTVAHFDRNYNLVSADMEGGRFVSAAAYEAQEQSG